MTNTARTFAAIVCTLVMSATCVIGAVGPAQAGSVTTVVQRSIA